MIDSMSVVNQQFQDQCNLADQYSMIQLCTFRYHRGRHDRYAIFNIASRNPIHRGLNVIPFDRS